MKPGIGAATGSFTTSGYPISTTWKGIEILTMEIFPALTLSELLSYDMYQIGGGIAKW